MTLANAEFATPTTESLADAYARDGYFCPIDVLSHDEAQAIRADLETAEAELADEPEKLALLMSYPDRLLPSFDRLIRHPTLIDAASQVLGPDLMVWSAGLFIKEPNTQKIVSWHQDLTYWGLDTSQEVTLWTALSPATVQSGCMKFVPGSHKEQQVAHVDTFADDNLLSRGQELAVEVDEADSVYAELQTGQTSMHHGHLFHASGPNTTDDRRIASAIRYIQPSMKQKTGDKALVAMVSGEDRFGNFKIAEPPRGRLTDEDFELCRQDTLIKRRIMYAGVDPEKGKRY